ncbi:beta-ketoacyl synthase N-terminal-like domain-containing protein [Actinosynnema sp. NPDC050436]|uniref:beta-ketoacyl synthase N-terminal-like domain-containing protein n=1 Tax=Actinosynnema sp. NPDC050436 TaxID=3155659 RepID=UPI0033F3BAFA
MSWLITGTGAVSSIGGTVADMFDALRAGRSGVAPHRGFDPGRFRARNAYEIDDRPVGVLDAPGRTTNWLVEAIDQAVRDAGLDDRLDDVPILVGTTQREMRSVELHWRDGVPLDPRDAHFGTALSRRFGAGATYTVGNACAASLYALGLATDLLDLDAADTVVVAGADTITESIYGLLDRCYPLPPDAVRPFDRNRRGMIQGDGAAAVVLQRDAPGRGARTRLRGVEVNCDAVHPSAPDTGNIACTMRQAHARAGLHPRDVDLILLHGTGTVLNDDAEAEAVGEVFAGVDPFPRTTAIKSMTGHTAGASGLHSLITAVESLRTSTVTPTVGVDDPIEAVSGLRLVRDRAERAELAVAQVNSFGFGGLNAVALVEEVRG